MHLAAVIWHFWIGLVFFVLSLVVVAGVIIGYLIRVQSPKYPKGPRAEFTDCLETVCRQASPADRMLRFVGRLAYGSAPRR